MFSDSKEKMITNTYLTLIINSTLNVGKRGCSTMTKSDWRKDGYLANYEVGTFNDS